MWRRDNPRANVTDVQSEMFTQSSGISHPVAWRKNGSPWNWDGSFVRWHFCKEQFCVGTITRVPLWLSSLQQKCLGWRIWEWWSRSYRESSSNFHQRFLQHRSRRASRLFLRCNPKLCWRWQSANKSINHRSRYFESKCLPCGIAFYRDLALEEFLQKWLRAGAWAWVHYGNHLQYFRLLFQPCASDCCTKQWRSKHERETIIIFDDQNRNAW